NAYYNRLDAQVLAWNPSVVFVLFGPNDIDWQANPSDFYKTTYLNYEQMTVQHLLEQGVRDVYVLSYPVEDYPTYHDSTGFLDSVPDMTEYPTSILQTLGDQAIASSKSTIVGGHAGLGMDIERPMRDFHEKLRKQYFFQKRVALDDGVHLN